MQNQPIQAGDYVELISVAQAHPNPKNRICYKVAACNGNICEVETVNTCTGQTMRETFQAAELQKVDTADVKARGFV